MRVPEKQRIITGIGASDSSYGNNGAFFIPSKNRKCIFKVIASDGRGWEHVSVSLPNRCPTWNEMCYIKDIFWEDDKTIIQYHPAKSEYINNHPFVLHLWRPVNQKIPKPDLILV